MRSYPCSFKAPPSFKKSLEQLSFITIFLDMCSLVRSPSYFLTIEINKQAMNFGEFAKALAKLLRSAFIRIISKISSPLLCVSASKQKIWRLFLAPKIGLIVTYVYTLIFNQTRINSCLIRVRCRSHLENTDGTAISDVLS